MTREEKIKIAIEKGYTCNPDTGEVFNPKGKKVGSKSLNCYRSFGIFDNKKSFTITIHSFIYYSVYRRINGYIDHINMNKFDNRINNLRLTTHQKNLYNTKAKGYSYDKNKKKYHSYINYKNKRKNLGFFDTEAEAKEAYSKAKQIYHKID